MIASLMGISLILSACNSATPAGTTAPTGTTASSTAASSTAASGSTVAASTTQATATSAQTTSSVKTSTPTRESLTFATYDDLITFDFDQAVDLFNKTFPNSKITSIDFDFADISWFYVIQDIDAVDSTLERSLRLNAVTGKIWSQEEANDDNDDKVIDLNSIITFKEAFELAKADTSPDSVIKEWQLDWDWFGGDFIWYEFDLTNPDAELQINAITRAIIK